MKNEIRDLLVGRYCANSEEDVFLNISKTDDGVLIDLVDREADIYYSFLIDGSLVKDFKTDEIPYA